MAQPMMGRESLNCKFFMCVVRLFLCLLYSAKNGPELMWAGSFFIFNVISIGWVSALPACHSWIKDVKVYIW